MRDSRDGDILEPETYSKHDILDAVKSRNLVDDSVDTIVGLWDEIDLNYNNETTQVLIDAGIIPETATDWKYAIKELKKKVKDA